MEKLKELPCEVPIFVMKKKWYITDLGTKLMSLFFLMPGIGLLSRGELFIGYTLSVICILAFFLSLCMEATRAIYCYEKFIIIKGIFFIYKTSYESIGGYSYRIQYPSFSKRLRIGFYPNFNLLFFGGITHSTTQYKEKDIKKLIEILEQKGVKRWKIF